MTLEEQIYDLFCKLTAEIAETEIAMKLVEAAKTGNPKEVEDVYENFKKEHPELMQSIEELKNKYDGRVIIGKKGFIIYDPEELDPFNFYFLMFFSGIEDCEVFERMAHLTNALRDKKHPKMADYFESELIEEPFYEMLVEIFKQN